MDSDRLVAAAGEAVGRRLIARDTLRGSGRTVVIRAGGSSTGDDTVIVKGYRSEHERSWTREAAALTVLRGRSLPVPELVTALPDPPLIVLADLGRGASLADALLGDDPAVASRRLDGWADALAAVHIATAGDRESFARALPDSTVDAMPALLADAADLLAEQLPRIGVRPDKAALAELRTTADALSSDASALTPADACPDNNIETPDGLVLLDFEQACFRHLAWDAAYLTMPWPSCWCSWRLPSDVARRALIRWRTAVAPSWPVVATATFDRDLSIAESAWAVMSSAWFLAAAIGGEQPGRGPTRRTVVRHRFGLARQRGHVRPHLARLAGEVLAATERLWSDQPLPLAPAYRAPSLIEG